MVLHRPVERAAFIRQVKRKGTSMAVKKLFSRIRLKVCAPTINAHEYAWPYSSTCGASARFYSPAANGFDEHFMVVFRLIRIGSRKLRDRNVELVTAPQVSCNLRGISGPGMRTCKRPSAQFDVFHPIIFGHVFDINGHLHVT